MEPCPPHDQLARLLTDELPCAERGAVETHVEQCSQCQQTLESLTHDTRFSAAVATDPAAPSALLHLRGNAVPETPTVLSEASLTALLAPAQGPGELGRLGGYRILKVLGQGGMGVVFQAEDLQLARPVALKVMKPAAAAPAARERFLREARACAALKNDHIVTIYQAGEVNGIPFLAMELLEGMPLDRRLEKGRPLPLPQVLQIGRQTALGLAAAHARGLVHRDIKPANLWLDRDSGRIKVLDFGLARAQTENVQLTQSGYLVGTPTYMAPEQARGEKPDLRCDLFSLGAVLYQLSTGELPFKGESMMAVLTALAVATPTPAAQVNPAIPPEFSDLIDQLLDKAPGRRPASAEQVAQRLHALERQLSCEGNGAAPVEDTRRQDEAGLLPAPPRRRFGLRRLGIALVLLSLVVALALKLLSPGEREGPRSDDASPTPTARPAEPLPPEFVNILGMKFVRVPRGKTWLGSIAGKAPKEEVDVPYDFYLGRYELTQGEWVQLMKTNPAYFCRTGKGRDAVEDVSDADLQRFPVENVSWNDAQLFLKKLNVQAPQSGWVYRLPTVVEWEFACRGGPMTSAAEGAFDFYFERPLRELPPNGANCDNVLRRPARVGSYPPNSLGLYDMHGNVWEWCNDAGVASYGKGWWLCGGAWDNEPWQCRAANRHVYGRGSTGTRGLRVARVPATEAHRPGP